MQSTEVIEFSVVIPLYNKEREIIRALESVFSQIKQPNEVIVVDDGSTDAGLQLVKQRYGSKVKLLVQQNSGVSVARNNGIREAASSFICLLDADDEWLPGYLLEIARLITHFPTATLYSTNIFYRDENGKPIPSSIGVPCDYFGVIEDFPLTFSKGYGLISSSSACIRKDIFDSGIIFPEGEKRGEDLYYWLRLGMTGSLAFSAKPYGRVNLNAQNRSISMNGILHYHFRWFYENKRLISNHKLFKSIESFIQKNAVIQAYGLKLAGDNDSVNMLIKLLFKNKDYTFIYLIPALLFPGFLLQFIMKIRRSIRNIVRR
ncbi:MAG: glycosyltransferase family 2 protein [Bacteroidales bacterium]|nr:glycosyltransferase family 2 protein [Bacteroidales bacterium]